MFWERRVLRRHVDARSSCRASSEDAQRVIAEARVQLAELALRRGVGPQLVDLGRRLRRDDAEVWTGQGAGDETDGQQQDRRTEQRGALGFVMGKRLHGKGGAADYADYAD